MRCLRAAAVVGALFCFTAAHAAVTANSAITPQTPEDGNPVATIVSAAGTTPQELYAGGTNGSKISAIFCTNTDTASYTIQLFLNHSSTNYVLASATLPASAGNAAGAAPLNLLAAITGLPVDGAGAYYLVKNGDALYVGVTGAVASGKTVACFPVTGGF